DEIRNKKLDVLRAIRPIGPDQVDQVDPVAVRGQYGAGQMDGQPVPGYRDEPDVASGSATETFAAVRIGIDNWRWQDVPFYLRTGKRLPRRCSLIMVQFRQVPHRSFPESAGAPWPPNQLIVHIQPEEGITCACRPSAPAR